MHIKLHDFDSVESSHILKGVDLSKMECRLAVEVFRIKNGPEYEAIGICKEGIFGAFGNPLEGNIFMIPWTLVYSFLGRLPEDVGEDYMECFFGNEYFH